jgi:phage/plasmid-like protein (TIGR03299 family)
MSHEVESMMYVGEVPWHKLGVRLAAPPTALEAIIASGLDWTAEKRQLYTIAHKNEAKRVDEMIVCPNRFAVVRETDNRILGTVSKGYSILQNRDAFNFFDPMVQAGECEYHTAGSLKEGERVWVLCKINTPPIEVVKGDFVSAYILLSNGHDGTHGVRVLFTPIRVVCANTLAAAEGVASTVGGKSLLNGAISLAHKGDINETLESLRETVNLAKRTFEVTMEQCQFLATKGVAGMEPYLREVFQIEPDVKVEELPKGFAEIQKLYISGRGTQIAGVAGTLWGAYNAVTEWVDHTRGSDRARMDNAWFGIGASLKKRAMEVAMTHAKAA